MASLRGTVPSATQLTDAELIGASLLHVTIYPDHLALELRDREPIVLPWSAPGKARRREIVAPTGASPMRPMKSEDRTRILRAIATARAWLGELVAGRIADTDAIATRENVSERSVRMTLALAHLAPRIVAAIVAGQLPRGVGVASLAALPASWREQERALGL